MEYLTALVLLGWLIYSWQIGMALTVMCGLIALFYGAALDDGAQEKVIKAFSWMVLAMSILMVGIVMNTQQEYDDGAPKMCNRVEC